MSGRRHGEGHAAATARPALSGAIGDRWIAGGLVRSYVVASFPVLCALTLGLGWWVTRNIEHEVIKNSAANLALYVQSFLASELQGLSGRDRLSEHEISVIHDLLVDTPLGKRVRALKIWKEGGLIVYYNHSAFIGRRFPPTANLRGAWRGEVTAEFDRLNDLEDAAEARLGGDLLEVYSPVREKGTDRVIAVVEFYQDAQGLAARLRGTRLRTWLVVIASTLATYGLLLFIVQRGGRVIRLQSEALGTQVDQLSTLLEQNTRLSSRLRRAARRATAVNEQQLRRVSAELHDGPAQSLSLALLRLDTLLDRGDGEDHERHIAEAVDEMRCALDGALTEVRQISRGLALPELDGLGLPAVLERVLSAHQQRTGEHPTLTVEGAEPPGPVGIPVKLTLYRVVQEALMNAHRHAPGAAARVRAVLEGDEIEVSVSDDGPGFDLEDPDLGADRLGLQGLQGRVEALGGDFQLASTRTAGTSVRARLPLRSDG